MKEVVTNEALSASANIVSKIVLSLWEKLKISYKEIMVPTPEHFLQYTTDCYDRFSNVKCLARNQAIMPLKRIYVPLTLVHPSEDIKYTVTQYDLAFFSNNPRVLIVDTAGMGKSTLVKRLFLDILDQGLGIPIFIELRRLSREHGIIDEIINQVTFLTIDIEKGLLFSFIRDGKFIFILDGYDEISLADKDHITNDLQDFISHSKENVFIMTSRQEITLTSFQGFETFRIKPLSKEEAFTLLSNYDEGKKEISTLLISKLKSSSDFDEFLGNPLLASMLLTAFSFKNEIPRQKHVFYRSVFDAYFNSHDLTKGGAYQHEKHSGLGIEEFHKVLRFIGAICLKKGKVEFSKDELIETIEQALKLCPEIKCSSGDYFIDLLEVVPMFIQDGMYYRWTHKSLYEYFAAQNICRDIASKDKILLALISEGRLEKNYNLLDLYYEIDFTNFRRIITKHFFQQFVSYVEEIDYSSPDLLKRRQCTFGRDEYFIIGVKEKDENTISTVAQKLFEKTGYHAIVFSSNKQETLFVARSSDDNSRELLISLFESKKHPAISRRPPIAVSSDHFTPGVIYQTNDDPENPVNRGEMGQEVTLLIESLDPFIDYYKAKEEIVSIDSEIDAAKAFADGLFS